MAERFLRHAPLGPRCAHVPSELLDRLHAGDALVVQTKGLQTEPHTGDSLRNRLATRTSNPSWGRHVRAALLLRDRDIASLAREINKSEKTLWRSIRGERNATDWETQRIADILEVPESFLHDGLTEPIAYRDRAAMLERLDQVKKVIRALEAEQRWLEQALAAD